MSADTLEHTLGQARAWHAVLNQTERWKPDGRPWMLVDDMTPSHQQNLLRWLVRRAERIEFLYGLGSAMRADHHEAVFDAPDDFDIPTHDDEKPNFDLTTEQGKSAHRSWCEEWIRTTPLAQRLAEAS